MPSYEFDLYLSADDYLQYYEGVVAAIQVRSHCGKRIQFSADKMRPFVLKDGIQGRFIMQLDNNNKFISIKKVC